MAQGTDLNAVGREDVERVLLAVADHFTETDPTKPLEPAALLIAFGAEAYQLTDRSISGGGPALARAGLAAAPAPRDGITRGEYALLLCKLPAAPGAEWGDDANERVIPLIPHPRTEPTPAPAEDGVSDTPSCCGRTMRRDGQQWVCDKCKSWHDLGGRAGVAR
jgi:hypothetical protein